MPDIQYITIEEALFLHERLIAEFGGSPGLRDPGLLDSALHRPRSGYYATLFDQAAALLQSLALNHAFIDGNKRMAIAVPFVFLRMNGVRIHCKADEGEKFLIRSVIEGKTPVTDIANWLRNHVKE